MRKYGQHDFWNFFNGIVVRWTIMNHCQVSRTHWKCMMCRFWSQRELGTSRLSLLLDQPTWRYYWIGWRLGIKGVSRIYNFIVKRHDICHNSNVFKVCESAQEHIQLSLLTSLRLFVELLGNRGPTISQWSIFSLSNLAYERTKIPFNFC